MPRSIPIRQPNNPTNRTVDAKNSVPIVISSGARQSFRNGEGGAHFYTQTLVNESGKNDKKQPKSHTNDEHKTNKRKRNPAHPVNPLGRFQAPYQPNLFIPPNSISGYGNHAQMSVPYGGLGHAGYPNHFQLHQGIQTQFTTAKSKTESAGDSVAGGITHRVAHSSTSAASASAAKSGSTTSTNTESKTASQSTDIGSSRLEALPTKNELVAKAAALSASEVGQKARAHALTTTERIVASPTSVPTVKVAPANLPASEKIKAKRQTNENVSAEKKKQSPWKTWGETTREGNARLRATVKALVSRDQSKPAEGDEETNSFFCKGIQHPIIHQKAQSNLSFCLKKWDFFKGEWRSKNCLYISGKLDTKDRCEKCHHVVRNLSAKRCPALFQSGSEDAGGKIEQLLTPNIDDLTNEVGLYVATLSAEDIPTDPKLSLVARHLRHRGIDTLSITKQTVFIVCPGCGLHHIKQQRKQNALTCKKCYDAVKGEEARKRRREENHEKRIDPSGTTSFKNLTPKEAHSRVRAMKLEKKRMQRAMSRMEKQLKMEEEKSNSLTESLELLGESYMQLRAKTKAPIDLPFPCFLGKDILFPPKKSTPKRKNKRPAKKDLRSNVCNASSIAIDDDANKLQPRENAIEGTRDVFGDPVKSDEELDSSDGDDEAADGESNRDGKLNELDIDKKEIMSESGGSSLASEELKPAPNEEEFGHISGDETPAKSECETDDFCEALGEKEVVK